MVADPIVPLLASALAARADLFDARHESAFRLFNGFTEGSSNLVADLYARTLLLHNYADPPQRAEALVRAAQDYMLSELPWVRASLLKTRNAVSLSDRRGVLLCGEKPDRRIREHGVWYAIDLLTQRDASFYLDTRNLRQRLIDHSAGQTVLNTFAYTGSLGVAARAGGASRVVHVDRNRAFLNVAKTSYTLNGFSIDTADFQAGDFFTKVSQLKRGSATFDGVIVDPPFFAETRKGTIDMIDRSARVINKVRPLVRDGGWLVVVNNALFVSGADHLRTLESLCADGYLSIDELIPVPPDITGYPQTRVGALPVDPAPFNHATKITVLRVRRKGPLPQVLAR